MNQAISSRQLIPKWLRSNMYSVNTPSISTEERDDTPRNPHVFRYFDPSGFRWDNRTLSTNRGKGTFPGNKTSLKKGVITDYQTNQDRRGGQ